MERLRVSDMERVARFSAELAAAEEIEPFPSRLLESFRLLVGSELADTREREILALIAEGRTNAEVAKALWISPATVRKHLENAYTKLGVTTRTAAIYRARQHRVITS